MALPPPHSTPELEALARQFHAAGIEKLKPLNKEDLALIGTLIQFYCFIDLNLDRMMVLFVEAGKIPTPKRWPNAKNRNDMLQLAIGGLPGNQTETQAILSELTEAEFRRGFRNLLAHWAALRLPESNAFVFLSMHPPDAKRSGQSIRVEDSQHAILRIDDLRGLERHLKNVGEQIAKKAYEYSQMFCKP